ncbi:hypothetical protein XELAEV_18024384mg [Xenopus laevis]|uniref:Uncharacterized protein n=1 Tax=Xenopus laevis TaxID=8355 RepID=A0A974CYT9_XENLA|nr:hypothetical protein XELAEV_18024384mg [Xenopus laevis]
MVQTHGARWLVFWGKNWQSLVPWVCSSSVVESYKHLIKSVQKFNWLIGGVPPAAQWLKGPIVGTGAIGHLRGTFTKLQ